METHTGNDRKIPFQRKWFALSKIIILKEKKMEILFRMLEWGLLAVKCSCTIEIPSYQNMLFWQLWKWKCCSSHLFSWKNLLQPLDLFDTPLPPSNASVKPPHYPSPSTKSKKFTQFLLSLDTIHAHFTCYFNFHIRAFIGCLRSLMCALALSLSLCNQTIAEPSQQKSTHLTRINRIYSTLLFTYTPTHAQCTQPMEQPNRYMCIFT